MSSTPILEYTEEIQPCVPNPQLPSDLFDHILSLIEDTSDLYNTCLSSWALYFSSSRYLYHTLEFHHGNSIIRTFLLLHRRPRLAGFVRSIDITDVELGFTGGFLLSPSYIRLLIHTFRLLTGLKCLRFYSWWNMDTNFSTCTFLLRDLVLAYEEMPVHFLSNQTLIERLLLPTDMTSKEVFQCPDHALIRLRVLTAPWHWALHLLPRRPVQVLTIDEVVPEDVLHNDDHRLSSSIGPLLSLRIFVKFLRIDMLQVISLHLVQLIELGVVTLQTSEPVGVQDVLDSATHVNFSTFPRFQSLRTLIIGSAGDKLLSDAQYRPFVCALGASSSALAELGFVGRQYGTWTMGDVVFVRYMHTGCEETPGAGDASWEVKIVPCPSEWQDLYTPWPRGGKIAFPFPQETR